MSDLLQLAQLGESLAATKKKLAQRALIGAYLKALPREEVAIAARLLIGRVFSESDPRILNLSATAVSRVLQQLTGTAMDWETIGETVDFGDASEKWLNARGQKPKGKPLQLPELYAAYEAIAQDTGAGSRERKDKLVLALLSRASPLEAKYIVKHLVKEMRVGVSEATVLDGLADVTGIPIASIRRANQISGDMGEVARMALDSGAAGLARLSVRLGVPLKPMLAQSAETMAEAFSKMDGPFALEFKLDGARVQIHKQGDAVHLYTRQLSDVTSSLPEVVEQVRAGLRAKDAILDGEVIAITAAGRPRPFQEVMRRFGRERDIAEQQKEIPTHLYLFDVLLADIDLCLDWPNQKRWEKLQQIRGSIDAVERIIPRGVADGERFLKRAREAGHEGLMAKQLASAYLPGERGRFWIKVKPVITLDLAIVAADWGYGRRTGWLSNVHLAARDIVSGEYVEVGKTFKGLTDAEFKTLTEQLLANKVSETRGTVWVKPSIVVEVAFNNVQRSPRYPGGVALRLARIINFRPDKSPEAADTIQTLQALQAAESKAPARRKKQTKSETST
jgi:DNA ligase-1